MVCDLDILIFVDSCGWEEKKNAKDSFVEDIGWRQAAQTKKSKKIIFFPLGGGEEIKNEEKEIEREKERKAFDSLWCWSFSR